MDAQTLKRFPTSQIWGVGTRPSSFEGPEAEKSIKQGNFDQILSLSRGFWLLRILKPYI